MNNAHLTSKLLRTLWPLHQHLNFGEANQVAQAAANAASDIAHEITKQKIAAVGAPVTRRLISIYSDKYGHQVFGFDSAQQAVDYAKETYNDVPEGGFTFFDLTNITSVDTASTKITITAKTFLDLIAAAEMGRAALAHYAPATGLCNNARQALNNALAVAIQEKPL